MTMTQAKWDTLPEHERERLRDTSGLCRQLLGLEGWRVAVIDTMTGERRRFIVGRSSGWRPCHIELANRRSIAGVSARIDYLKVQALYQVRGKR